MENLTYKQLTNFIKEIHNNGYNSLPEYLFDFRRLDINNNQITYYADRVEKDGVVYYKDKIFNDLHYEIIYEISDEFITYKYGLFNNKVGKRHKYVMDKVIVKLDGFQDFSFMVSDFSKLYSEFMKEKRIKLNKKMCDKIFNIKY